MYSSSSTLPRGFRFHHEEPKTPEPAQIEEDFQQPPSPPRARLKVRRRNASSSSFAAPTQQFLASVAAEDVPIPTIEEPMPQDDLDMPDRPLMIQTSGFLAPRSNYRSGEPPKTPVPESTTEDSYSGLPDWSATSSPPPAGYFQRSMSSCDSDCSDDSFYSGSRISRPSDDGSCTSPESDCADVFFSSTISKGKGKALFRDQPFQSFTSMNTNLHSKKKQDSPWTKAQNAHLWSTYMIYLQDPTVTPWKAGPNSVPPQGVVYRVAREAKRSWKGPDAKAAQTIRRSTKLNSTRANSYDKSGSITPTAEAAKTYVQWPHSSNRTRAHLRELCKMGGVEHPFHQHHQSRTPTPFSKAYFRDQSETPRSFHTSDFALSLTTSTSESMQPDGPLAKLASADPLNTPPLPENELTHFSLFTDSKPLGLATSRGLLDDSRGRRLGSPFMARTCGPSSSKVTSRPAAPRTRSDTITEPRLGSPVRFDGPRSLNTTMKRRAQNSLEEELSPSGALFRPSILTEQLFGQESRRRVRSRGFSLGDEALRHRVPGIVSRSPPAPSLPTATESPSEPMTPPQLLPSVTFDPPRLGSPFSESASKTFPRRLFQDGTATVRRGQFATMHQTRRSVDSASSFTPLASRTHLSHLDEKLKEIKARHAAQKQLR